MKKKLLKPLLVGAMTLSMAFAASAVTFADETPAADNPGEEPAVITWAQLYQGMGLEAPTGQEGYYDAVSSATGISPNVHRPHIPAVVHQIEEERQVADRNGAMVNAIALDGVVLSGKEAAVTPKLKNAYWEPSVGKAENKKYGTDELIVVPDDTVAGYTWNDYLTNLYAVTVSNGSTTVGALPWVDFYGEKATQGPHYNKVEIAINNNSFIVGDARKGQAVHRFDAFYTDGVLNAGTYTVTVYSEGYTPLTAEIVVPTWTDATVSAADADVSATSTAVTLTGLPKDYAPAFAVDGTEVTYKSGAVSYGKLSVGSHTLTVTDSKGKYNSLSATFTVSTAYPIAYYNGTAIAKAGWAEDADFTNYVGKITKTVVAGVTYNATGRGSVQVIQADGTIDLSKTTSAAATEPVEITVMSTGYPDLTFTTGTAMEEPAQPITGAVVTAKAATYTGKALTPAVKVTLNGAALSTSDYTVAKGNYKNAGRYTLTVTGKGKYTGTATGSFVIGKAAQKIKVTAKKQTYKVKKLKKKARSFTITKAVRVSGAKGKLTYQIKPANAKAKKALKVKGNKVTVKKKTKKGTYKLKVTVRAAANANYNAAAPVTKTVTVKVK